MLFRSPVTAVSFAPSGVLGVAQADGVSLYAMGTWDVMGRCVCAPGLAGRFDFSDDSTMIQVATTGTFEVMFFLLESFEAKPAAEAKDKGWATKRCALAYAYKGVAPSHRHGKPESVLAADATVTGAVCVVADDYGALNLFNYPCVQKGSGYHSFYGHEASASKDVVIIPGDASVLSAGGADGCVIQWHLLVDEAIDEADAAVGLEEEAAQIGRASCRERV